MIIFFFTVNNVCVYYHLNLPSNNSTFLDILQRFISYLNILFKLILTSNRYCLLQINTTDLYIIFLPN